jgi:hypothetical protein
MKKNAFLLAIAVGLLLASAALSGCGPKSKMYAWGNYSKTLYHCKKNPTDENILAHRNELLRIMAESEEHNMRVPPGVCAEYAYILMKEGNIEEANKYLDREELEYPESKQLVAFVRTMMKGRSD